MTFKENLRRMLKPTEDEKEKKHKKDMRILQRELEKEKIKSKLVKHKKKSGGAKELPDFLKL